MSWEDQGRQEHGWFGHGTAPPKLKPDGDDRGGRFGLDGLDQRLRAIGHTAIAAIPRKLRYHSAASYEGPALDQLVATMRAWVRGLLLDRAEFAGRYFGRGVNDPVVDHLWQAAKFAAIARNEAELRSGTEHLAAAMQAEGLDRWRRFMNDAQQRAAVAAHLPVPALSGDPEPAAPKATSSAKMAASGKGGIGTALPVLDVTPPGTPITVPGVTSDLGGTTVRLGTVTLAGTMPVTADQLRAIMPNAGDKADRYVEALNQAMAAHGINTPAQRAAFLAQISAESGQLHDTVEKMNYSSAQRIHQVWPRHFLTEAAAQPYVHNPEALANRAYANRNGNGSEASGDGYRFRGRGLIQVTGRDKYRRVGFEDNPEALAEPKNAANSAAAYWQNESLNERTTRALNRVQFDAVSRTVNGGDTGLQERWNTYQRALSTLSVGR